MTAANGNWPCHAGCDDCCRHLAALPQITAHEAELLREGIATLPNAVQDEVRERFAAIQPGARPIVCPLLDRDRGQCLVYAWRPLACRAYGFYVERDKGLYCEKIQKLEELGILNSTIWGNWQSILARCGTLQEFLL